MGRERRDYWEAQLSEYWDSGLTIQEYSEFKELPYESPRRWIRVSQKTLKCIDSRANFKSIGSLVLITCFFVRQNRFGALIQTFFTKNGKKSNFGPFSSSPVNAGCSRYPVVYVSLISSIQAC
ncbi:MAG: hypothetical protein L6W00_30350 [Lentisphaeria bacterium]|nr:MAG: hypothetical protein L6W00_30350 [Lentisphaeria bacterium]